MKPINRRAARWHMFIRECRYYGTNDGERNYKRMCKRQASKALRQGERIPGVYAGQIHIAPDFDDPVTL